MFSFNKKEYYNRLIFKKIEIKKLILKTCLANKFLNKNLKFFLFKNFLNFNKYSSISYYRNYCLINNWSRSVFRDFKMSRHQAKAFSSFGLVCGLRKSSF